MTDLQPLSIRSSSDARALREPDASQPATVAWPAALRALREARGLTQEGWGAQLGVSDVTIRRWERGAAVPTAHAEAALLEWCGAQRMFRTYDSGPLRGVTLTSEGLSELLAAARLAARPQRSAARGTPSISIVPPAGLAVPPVRLPLPTTSLVDRVVELDAIRSLLAAGSTRLITLIGTGGAGKTRLAIEAARPVADDFAGGVWFADLAPVTAAALVPQTVATLLDVRSAPGRSLTTGIADVIGDRRLLLLLDNCEQVAEAASALVSALLQTCVNLTVVATSRQPLRVPGEQVYPVPPLAVPPRWDEDASGAAAALADSAAVRLFVERSRLVRPEFALVPSNAAAVAEICRRLDGLPLAIELAAARVRALSPEQIAERLSDRFRIVAGGAAGDPARHRTLEALLDWSYNLLTPTEQALLRRLSIFRGGCTLDAVEQVCGGNGIERQDALELMLSLIDKSLVVAEFAGNAARYRLLESVREYAAARLADGVEEAEARDRHAGWYLRFAQELEAGTDGSPHQLRLDAPRLVVEEFDNLRVAFDWSLGDGRAPSRALALCNALWWFWPYHTLLAEGRTWYERSLAAVVDGEEEARAQALAQAGMLAFLADDYRLGETLAGDAAEQADNLELPVLRTRALRALALNKVSLWDFATAQAHLEEAVALMRVAGNRRWLCFVLDTLGFVLVSREQGVAARRCLEESLALAEAEGMDIVAASSYMYLGMCCSLERDVRGALAHYVEAFERAARIGHRNGPALIISALALSILADGRPLEAAQLLGAWQAQSRQLGINAPPRNRGHLEEGLAAIRAAVGDEACEAALATGRAMSIAEVESFVRKAALTGQATLASQAARAAGDAE